MSAPWDTQVGIWTWDINLLDWRKVTLDDFNELFQGGARYTRRYAYNANNDVEYMGFAEPGTSSASPFWKLIKLTYSGRNVVASEFAEASINFSFIWDIHDTYNYS